MKKTTCFALTAALIALVACKGQESSDGVKYADAPIAQVPQGALSNPPTGNAGPSENFEEFKKTPGCTTEEEIKKKNARMAATGEAATLQGAKDPDCAVK